jgi:hypothetical protein
MVSYHAISYVNRIKVCAVSCYNHGGIMVCQHAISYVNRIKISSTETIIVGISKTVPTENYEVTLPVVAPCFGHLCETVQTV